tara:strand:+ start:1544 stop:1936 length:393 start_codon:yes stop_codon:yes gene_type:complete
MEYINNMDDNEPTINLNKEEFSNNVKQYLALDEEIAKLNIAIRERKKKQKALSGMLIKNMEDNNIQHINIKNGALVYKNSTAYKGLNKKTLLNGLSIYFKRDEIKVSEAHQTIYDNREKFNKVSLKLKKF